MDDLVHRYVAFAGGWYAGKTWAGARKLADLHVRNAFDPLTGEPTGVKSLIVAQNYKLAKTQNIPEMQAAFDEMGLTHKFNAGAHFAFELPDLGTKANPSEVLVYSAETPETITGFTVGCAWGDEAGRWNVPHDGGDPLRNPFIQIDGRVRDAKAQIRQINYTFTHEGDDTQVFQDFEENPLPDHVLYRSDTRSNPTAREFAKAMELRLTPKLAEQYLAGKAVRFNGTNMYSSFTAKYPNGEACNVDDRIELQPGQPLHLAIDFNIDPGMHGVLGQFFPQDDLLTARTVLHHERMDVIKMMAELVRYVKATGGWRFSELHVFGDATGRNKWAGSGESCWDIVIKMLREIGWPYKLRVGMSNPLVADRVATFNCALQDLRGNVKYKMHPDCKQLIADMKTMKWKNGEADKNERMISHASDAEGYRVWMLKPIRKWGSSGGSTGGMVSSVI